MLSDCDGKHNIIEISDFLFSLLVFSDIKTMLKLRLISKKVNLSITGNEDKIWSSLVFSHFGKELYQEIKREQRNIGSSSFELLSFTVDLDSREVDFDVYKNFWMLKRNLENGNLLFVAETLENAEMYEEMFFTMKIISMTKKILDPKERDMLSRSFKKYVIQNLMVCSVVGDGRRSFRVVEKKLAKEERESRKKLLKIHLFRISKGIISVSKEYLRLFDVFLIPNVLNSQKGTKGDLFRYMYEVEDDEEKRKEYSRRAAEWYNKAQICASSYLGYSNPMKLSVALNYSVYKEEVLGDTKGAIKIAKEAFDGTISILDNVKEDTYKDLTLMMELLRDNITLWQSEDDDDDETDKK